MRGLFAALLLALLPAACGMTMPAMAHGPAKWIQDGAYKNGAGELCCGERDCGEKVSGTVVAGPDGYRVDATFQGRMPDGTVFTQQVNQLIPYHQTQPSPDGIYWVCIWGGQIKCFFAPPPGS